MKIKTITFGRLKTFGNFENIRIEATADVGRDTPEATLEVIQKWVDDKILKIMGTPWMDRYEKRMDEAREELREITKQIEDKRKLIENIGKLERYFEEEKRRREEAERPSNDPHDNSFNHEKISLRRQDYLEMGR